MPDHVLQLIDAAEPEAIALTDASRDITRGELREFALGLSGHLSAASCKRVGLLADNSIEWVLGDLACMLAGIVFVPLPLWFSASQLRHVVQSAGLDAVLCEQELADADTLQLSATDTVLPEVQNFRLYRREVCKAPALPAGTAKITFTSGTTGMPKGVCLDLDAQMIVAHSIAASTGPLDLERHLCVLPLCTLLENVAGVYASLLAGMSVVIPPLAEIGIKGAAGFAPGRFAQALETWNPSSLILVPQLLGGWLSGIRAGLPVPESLRFVAVGGGRVGETLIQNARAQGIPVYEGYGLSECGSVQCLNLPGKDKPGSAGKPLPHTELRIDEHGEILARGNRMLGYLGERKTCDLSDWQRTGDLGEIDDEGFLHIRGRAKNIFITSFGRNVSPEWVESELCAEPEIAQVAVFGEASPINCALLLAPFEISDQEIAAAVARANCRLPDYARAHRWLRISEPFSMQNGQLTANGRLRRDAILARYGELIEEAQAQSA